MPTEHCVLIYRHGRASGEEPEQEPAEDAEAAARRVFELAADGINAEAVYRHVEPWTRDRHAETTLAELQVEEVQRIVREYAEGERDLVDASDCLRRYSPSMSVTVRAYWIRELAALLRLANIMPESVEWITSRIQTATEVLAGHLHPNQSC
ncbi:hypothetical protein ABZ801_01275 [Actinomadura sp. NPDC047616]|uniref:hypothetical protein n=1 Tax=Actinomadura sp. NPDC047616 TaxID=3155914 RepID=UPI0033D1EE75